MDGFARGGKPTREEEEEEEEGDAKTYGTGPRPTAVGCCWAINKKKGGKREEEEEENKKKGGEEKRKQTRNVFHPKDDRLFGAKKKKQSKKGVERDGEADKRLATLLILCVCVCLLVSFWSAMDHGKTNTTRRDL